MIETINWSPKAPFAILFTSEDTTSSKAEKQT